MDGRMEATARISDADLGMASQYALSFQMIDYGAIRRWGDELLLSRDPAPIWAMDLAVCHDWDVDERLRRIPGTPRKDAWQNVLCGLMALRWKQRQITIGTMRGIGWDFYTEEEGQDLSHWGLKLECIGEGYDDGYGTLEALTEAADSCARSFEQYECLVPTWMADSTAEPNIPP